MYFESCSGITRQYSLLFFINWFEISLTDECKVYNNHFRRFSDLIRCSRIDCGDRQLEPFRVLWFYNDHVRQDSESRLRAPSNTTFSWSFFFDNFYYSLSIEKNHYYHPNRTVITHWKQSFICWAEDRHLIKLAISVTEIEAKCINQSMYAHSFSDLNFHLLCSFIVIRCLYAIIICVDVASC